MKDQHINGILESAPLARLGEGELAAVRAHAGACAECRRAYAAARAADALLRERASETFEPSPFFQTRVLAALRVRRAEEEVPAFSRLWRAAGSLASSMAAAVALLAVFTVVAPDLGLVPRADEDVTAAASDPYESVLLAQEDAGEGEMDYDQVFTAVYASGEEAGDGDE